MEVVYGVIAALFLVSAGVEGTGQWSKCVGYPPEDSFLVPNGEMIPARSKYGLLGRAYPKGHSEGNCVAYFPFIVSNLASMEIRGVSGEFYVLRKLRGGLKENGQDYEWIDYKDYHYGTKSCTPVKYDEEMPQLICYLKNARLINCNKQSYQMNTLGLCDENTGESLASSCHRAYNYDAQYTSANAQVLCLRHVARREVTITAVDPISGANIHKKPVLLLTDSTRNGGSLKQEWTFEQTWKKETSSIYSTEHGWRVKVGVTYKSGLLNDAIAKWEVSVESEGHGKYTTENGTKTSETMVYKRQYQVPKRSFFSVRVQIYRQSMNVPYEATEKYFDDKDNVIGEYSVRGTWKGVFTFAAKAIIKERPL